MDAYTTLKFNFDGVYDVFNSIAQTTNSFVSKQVESPANKAVNRATEQANDNAIMSGLNAIENLDQNINLKFDGYHQSDAESGMIAYADAFKELKQGLLQFKEKTMTDKKMSDRVSKILATIENTSTVLPATQQLQTIEKAAKSMIGQKIKENKELEKRVKQYDSFIKSIQNDPIVLVDDTTTSATFSAPLLTMDDPTKNILQSQEDPTKTYLDLNKRMVQGYLDAVNNDGPEKLNMSANTYKQSKKYLEETKDKIDTALLAYTDTAKPLLAQG